MPHIKPATHPEWLDSFNEMTKFEFHKIIEKDCYPVSGEIRMGEVIHQLSLKTKGEAIIVTDVGQHQMSSARYYQFNRSNTMVTSGGLGTMGFGLPAAIGAKMGAPKSQVIAIIGDGGFQMTIQELGTLAQLDIPVKIILMNNGFLGMVRQWQDLFFEKRYAYTKLTNPDFIKIADGFGISGRKIREREELSRALDDLLAIDKPFLLEVKVMKEDNVFPMVPAGGTVSEMRLE
jgi:acetolactate synthase-1/2/3 large subunit